MKFSFIKLPRTYQLPLAGIIPLLVLLYVSGQLYFEKENSVSLVSEYSSHIREAALLESLTSELEAEAEYSLAFALNKGRYSTLVIQRSRTDKWIHTLEETGDTSLKDFLKNAFHNGLVSTRAAGDDGTFGINVRSIMDFYNGAIWQLSTIYTVAASNNSKLQPLNEIIESKRLLFEMETMLTVTRNKIYVFLAAHDTPAIVSTADDALHILKTYEKAFLVKAPPSLVNIYHDKENANALRPAFDYLDYAVIHHQFDTTRTAGQWWAVASVGIKMLNRQYLVSQQQLQKGMNQINQNAIKARDMALLLLAATIVLVTGFFIFIVRAVNMTMKERASAPAKVSQGNESIANNSPKNNVSDLILEAIYRAGKTSEVKAADATNSTNGHAIPEAKTWIDKDAVHSTNGETKTGKLQAGWKNETPNLPLNLHKLQEDPAEAVNDDLANYGPKPQIVPAINNNGKGEAGKENTAKAEQLTESLTNQMNELIDAAAIESGRLNYHKHIFKLNELVSEMASETKNVIPSYKISLRKNAALSVYGDRARIAQVLGNLFQNAIDHCADADTIIVNLEEKGQTAVCSVEDFGNGIAIDQQEKIFGKFYRVNNTKAMRPGLGLGLYIAIEIIKQHQGQMWVRSEPGLGSTFYFSLPLNSTLP